MKPTHQVTPQERNASGEDRTQRIDHRRFPATDFQFHTALQRVVGASVNLEKRLSEARSFRRSSNQFLAGDAVRDFLSELSAFIVISAVSASALLTAGIATMRMARGW